MKKTVVLTSRQNFVWLSMQEIIPFIEKSWLSTAVPGQHQVVCRDVDEHSISELMPLLLSADNIVFTCFTVKLCKIGQLLRGTFSADARYFIYLHNQATILCWPFHAWGMGPHLRENDVFISSSTADAATLRHSFERCRVEVIPFTLSGIKPEYPVPMASKTRIPFVYVGRLSAQKNIHTLIYSFRIFQDANPGLPWRLLIYGTDDNLGSPNMGMPSRDYGKSLKALTRVLGLEDRLTFKGFRDRAEINRFLSRHRHIATSASLHSDENFGMAQFRSLCRGNAAVLTRWGGYADFGNWFSERVFLASVQETKRGPNVDPVEFARLLGKSAEAYARGGFTQVTVGVPSYYSERSISARLLSIAEEGFSTGRSLKMTAFARRILEKQASYERRAPGSSRIFESYADPDAKIPFRSYMISAEKKSGSPGRQLLCHPWVRLEPGAVRVSDPHRGEFEIRYRIEGRKPSVLLSDWYGRTRKVSREAATRLLSLGYSRTSGSRGRL